MKNKEENTFTTVSTVIVIILLSPLLINMAIAFGYIVTAILSDGK